MRLYPASFGHHSYAFNAQLNSDGSFNAANERNTTTLGEREDDPGFRDMREPLHLAQGGSMGRVHKNFRAWRLRGRLVVPDASQPASLSDKERAMRAAFDPYLCFIDSPTTEGVYPFDFQEPTTDTATYPTGRISLRYYARPVGHPRFIERENEFGERPYSLILLAPDPRVYEQTEQTLALTPGTASGDVLNRGTVPAPLKATIVMSGAGASNFTITRSGVSFVLNLSTMVNLDTIVVLFEPFSGPYARGRRITKNGSDAFSLKTSQPSTWLDVPVGTTTFSISNHTNVTSCTLAWHSARA